MTTDTQSSKAPLTAGEAVTVTRKGGWEEARSKYDTSESVALDRVSWRERLSSMLSQRSAPALLVSVIVHTALLLLLALLVIREQISNAQSDSLTIDVAPSVVRADQPLVMMAGEVSSAASVVTERSTTEVSPTTQSNAPAKALLSLREQGLEPKQYDVAQSAESLTSVLAATNTGLNASFASTGIDGRRPETRAALAKRNGGTPESEQAVENALAWLAAHQLPSGAWSLVHDGGECNGRCRNPGSKERYDPAATGLALLAFLGAGYTHQSGKYKDNVHRGVYFLYQIMEETKEGGSFMYTSDLGMYNHGIATFALCEAYQMTEDPDLRRAAQQAIDFIVSAQNYSGGWGYLPMRPGDLTISGWQVMALKSAHAAGLSIPAPVVFRLDNFLKEQRLADSHFFRYRGPEKAITCTAIGHMLRMFRGASTTDGAVLESADFFNKRGLDRNDVYYNYYTSLFMFHIGGPVWEQWNAPVRDYLISTQATGGHEAGSWYFENQYGKEGGRLYTTAMAAMNLEVYYRYSPLYQQTAQPFEL